MQGIPVTISKLSYRLRELYIFCMFISNFISIYLHFCVTETHVVSVEVLILGSPPDVQGPQLAEPVHFVIRGSTVLHFSSSLLPQIFHPAGRNPFHSTGSH